MNRTKNAIIDTFWQLLDEKPYNKITVKDIVNRCQISRNTFYYHFHDITELLEITLKTDADDIIQTYGESDAPLACITNLIERCTVRKKAILHIYRSVLREYFMNELERIALYTVTRYIDTVTAGQSIPDDSKMLLIRFYKCLFVGIFLDWLDNGMKYELSRYITQIDGLFNDAIEQAYLKVVRST